MQETWDADSILGWEDPLEEVMATQASILIWRIPWTKEPGGLQSIGVTKSLTRLKWLSPQIEYTSIKVRKKTDPFWDLWRRICLVPLLSSGVLPALVDVLWLAEISAQSLPSSSHDFLTVCMFISKLFPFIGTLVTWVRGPPSWNNITSAMTLFPNKMGLPGWLRL